MANDDWTEKPFASWLENTIRELVNANPVAIAMEMVDETGLVSTCYYNTSANDRACMIDAMRDDARWEWLYENKDEVRAILEDEDDEQESGDACDIE
jgi:hypothetical protein